METVGDTISWGHSSGSIFSATPGSIWAANQHLLSKSKISIEINGPLIDDLEKLPVTKPEYASFYRATLAGEIPYLKLEQAYTVRNFMPEAVLHKALYGTFQMFVGDIMIYRIAGAGGRR